MAKRFYRYFPWLFVLMELLALSGSFTFLLVLFGFEQVQANRVFDELLLLAGTWILLVLLRKDYKLARTGTYTDTLYHFTRSFVWAVLIFYLIRTQLVAAGDREVGFLVFVGALSSLAFFRIGVHMSLRRYRMSGRNYRKAVIVGKDDWSTRLASTLAARKALGIQFLGFFDDSVTGKDVLGDVSAFFQQAKQGSVDLVYLGQHISGDLQRKIVDHADENHIKVKIIPGAHLQWEKALSFSRYGRFVVVNLNEIPLDKGYNRLFKRFFDICFSCIVLVFILSWLTPLLALLIKLESDGPVFFFQQRTGANNRVFRCIKFRTMLDNPWADTRQAIRNDPRITKTGAFLRRFSLDELPQFINVLKGEMSVVGPRPHTLPMNQVFKRQIQKYDNRHRIKPGITGLAQVLGYRGEISHHWQIRSRVRLDYFYIRNWSFLLDLTIVFRTMGELIARREEVY
ncbi:putative colanic acid biosysnthesis UDP-glucose lipid carrier transferase [Cyclobacterium lianum]|uniref:Putative colanic acid biosysnthesis UDP-glucose lipid carrier transferase n=1 Tax=Cyclobacterium lianum TaxID=388280 RepID=A0A1M7JVF7_9BACT|nr:exopolysaccharide biosynthesis polyprenyl glycosylphosphotransferase [Cyclobacterium lianum]SHM56693.1 putative colanic acid biosysnthesis UDP-glucose lipid carrier transferase [Cyclobacterium lianum]